jgi:hypothetical protein
MNHLNTIFTNKINIEDSENSTYKFNKKEYKKNKKQQKKYQQRENNNNYTLSKLELIPIGGFPPIFLCNKENNSSKLIKDKKILRSFSKNDKILSIKEIMESKTELKPFTGL